MIETKRLRIIPLSYAQVQKFINLNNELENELGLNDSHRTISPQLKHAIENYTLKWLSGQPENHLYCTMWIIVEKENKIIIGDLSFKGAPNKNGDIEIGYGTQPLHQRNGYMTEAVQGMIEWAGKQNGVKSILAETRSDNLSSIKILKKNRFSFLTRKGGMYWWTKIL
jgi:RimJ/RimL family protein N-acetyltransferase